MDLWAVVCFSSLAYALAVVVVETRVLLAKQKFWPLAMDDYLVAAVLFAGVVLTHRVTLVVGWALALGTNLPFVSKMSTKTPVVLSFAAKHAEA